MSGVFRYLSSVRLAVVLLILIILLSIIGTLIPQGQELSFYQNYLPRVASLIVFLGFNHLYRSPLFLSLVFLFLLNLLFCSIKQLGAKLKRLKSKYGLAFDSSCELESEKIRLKLPKHLKADPNLLIFTLQKKKYQIKTATENDRKLILARKGIPGLFGPEIVHLGLMIIIIGGLVSALLSYRTSIAFIEGETAKIPGKNFSLRLDKFTTEYYPNGSVKDWKSSVSVIEDNQVRASALIEVNHPFKYGGLNFYQMSYGQDWEKAAVELEVKTKETPARRITLKAGEMTKIDPGLTIRVLSFVPDFQIDSAGQVFSRSPEPNNPAVLVEIQSEGQPAFSGWVFYLYQHFTSFHRKTRPDLEVTLKKFEAPVFSVLEASSDPGSKLVWIGSALLMLGLLFSFYLPYKELRILVDSSGQVRILPYARKNRDGFLREIDQLLEDLIEK